MNSSKRSTRRDFLKHAGLAVAAPYVIPAVALGAGGRAAPSERIVMAGIGIGNMGSGDQRVFTNHKNVQYVAVCDVKKKVRDQTKGRVDGHYRNSDCKTYNDFRDVLGRDDIEAVHIATPDHWHAQIVVMTCRAGKDVYCQKPESRTIREGRLMVEAVRRYGRVFSGGSQRVLGDHGALAEKCWSGELGTIKAVYADIGGPSTHCNLPAEPVPEGVDWDLWLGPAPWAPYNEKRISGTYGAMEGKSGWRAWSDYSGGHMTDWGAHKFGGAMFAADIRDQGPVEIIPPDGKDNLMLTYRFANGMLLYRGQGGTVRDQGLGVEGTPGERLPAKTMPRYHCPGEIYDDFLHCIRTRERPFRDIEFAHRTVTVCHLGCIAYELNRPLKWDPVKEEFPGDEEANRFLDCARREPWQL